VAQPKADVLGLIFVFGATFGWWRHQRTHISFNVRHQKAAKKRTDSAELEL